MISLMRNFTKSWIFQGVLILLMASFAIYGLRDVFGPHSVNTVISAGKRDFSADEFKHAYEQNKQRIAEQNPNVNFTPDQFVAEGQHLIMIDQLASQIGFNAWLDTLHIVPSKALIGHQLRNEQAFFDPVTGHFDKETYHRLLAQNGTDPKAFERRLADEIATAQYGDAALSGLKAPRIAAVVDAAFATQTRDASLFLLSPETVAKPAQPTDADLQAFYKDHTKDMIIPETRTAVLVKFDPAEIASTIPADEDALKKAYAAQSSTLGTPEQRTFVEVTAPDAGAANAIASALKAGQSPDAVAAAHGGHVIAYTSKAQADIPDTKIAAAAFGMKPGDVSGPVVGDLGTGVIKLTDVKASAIPPYETARAKLLTAYQAGKAADKINQIVNEFQKAHDAGEPFDTTVQKMGLKVQPLQPMTSEGRTGTQQDYTQFPNLVKAVYELQVNQSSDVEEQGGGVYYALKLLSDKPAGPPPFDQIKSNLAQGWVIEKLATAITAQADQATAKLNAGESLEKVAAEFHAVVQPVNGIDRGGPIGKKLGPAIMGHVFNAKVGETFQATADRIHIAIGRLDAVHQAAPEAINSAAASLRPQFSQSVTEDIGIITRKVAREAVKTKTYPDVAVRAIGVTPADTSSASASKAKS